MSHWKLSWSHHLLCQTWPAACCELTAAINCFCLPPRWWRHLPKATGKSIKMGGEKHNIWNIFASLTSTAYSSQTQRSEIQQNQPARLLVPLHHHPPITTFLIPGPKSQQELLALVMRISAIQLNSIFPHLMCCLPTTRQSASSSHPHMTWRVSMKSPTLRRQRTISKLLFRDCG